MEMQNITVSNNFPKPEEFIDLRVKAGLST